jgi:nitrate reductase alpha subunit
MTETLTRKAYFGHVIGTGFEADVHSVSGAPKEAYARVVKAEDAGVGGERLWRPVTLGLRPHRPSEALTSYLAGAYLRRS